MYHSISKESAERIEIENRINQMTQYLKKYQNKVKEFGPGFEKYFNLHYDEKSQAFILPEERCSVVERELDLAGYFCIVTSEKMSAKEAIELYKSRDVSEKLFRGDKSYLGNKSIRVYSEESARAKIFVEFVAMIVRCKMYIKLKEEMKKLDKKLNYMTVPAAIKELEKIEMVRQLDNIYRLDHAVTANQKVILKAFGLDANSIKYFASELSKELKEAVLGRKIKMARTRKTSKEALEEKIEKAEADVIAAKKKYDQATANLKELLDKRDAIRKEEILSAVVKSGRSYEEIMNFLNAGSDGEKTEK